MAARKTPPAAAVATHRRSNRGLFRLAISALIVLIPLVLLFEPGSRPSSVDWENGLWSIGYTTAYLRHHAWFPAIFNTQGLTGHPVPILYGPLLYPLLSIFALPLGPDWGLRVAVAALCVLQFALVRRVIRLASGRHVTAIIAAAIVTWEVYPLTNLYNRAAIGEFFATAFLTCSVCAGACALLDADYGTRRSRLRRVGMTLLCGWCGAAAAGMHGITAMVGGVVLACLAPAGLLLRPQAESATPAANRDTFTRRLAIAMALVVGVTIVLAPWLYAASRFVGQFNVQSGPLRYVPEYDSWFARLSPVPFDNRSATFEGRKGQPFLDAQLSVALLALLIGVGASLARRRPPREAWRRYGLLLAVSLVLFIALLFLSVMPSLGHLLPTGVAGTIQWAYRLVSYQNLTLLTALVATLLLRRSAEPTMATAAGDTVHAAEWVPVGLAIVLGVSALGVKLAHAATSVVPIGQIQGAPDFNDENVMLQFPRSYYGWRDYVVLDPARQLPPLTRLPRVQFQPGLGPDYGDVAKVSAQAPADIWVATTVLAFPWNHVLLDGAAVPESETRTTPDFLVVHVPPGRHTIAYGFVPPPAWPVLRTASLVVFAAWAVLTLAVFSAAASRSSGLGPSETQSNA